MMSLPTDEHAIQIKIIPNLQYRTSSLSAATVESSATSIDTGTQQSPNSSVDNYEQQQNPSRSINTNSHDVTITHSNSLLSDWAMTNTSNIQLQDDRLIYDDLLDDEDDLDNDLHIEDMLECEAGIGEGYPEDFC